MPDRPLPDWAQQLIDLRENAGWLYSQLAREIKIRGGDDVPSVESLAHMIRSDWEKGKHRPKRYVHLIAQVYGIAVSDLLAAQEPERVKRAPADMEKPRDAESAEERMKRRELLESLTVLGMAATIPEYASGRIRTAFDQIIPEADSDANTAEDWQEAAIEYAESFLTATPNSLLPDLAADALTLREVIVRKRNSHRARDLYGAAAIIAALLAETLNAVGMSRESRHWWRSAGHAASVSGNPGIRVWVAGQEAMNGIYQERPPYIVLGKAEAAIQIAADNPSPGLLEALACKAQILADMGDATKSIGMVNRLEAAFNSLPTGQKDDRPSRMVWPEHRLWHTMSYVYTACSQTKKASNAQERALGLYAESRVRPRTQIELHRARCIILDGDPQAGIEHAARVVDGMPHGYFTKAVQVIAGKVLGAVHGPETKRPAVESYRELIALPR